MDFILTIDENRIPLEIKYRQHIDPQRDTVGLRAFLEKRVYTAPFALLITMLDDISIPDQRIIPVSLTSLLLLRQLKDGRIVLQGNGERTFGRRSYQGGLSADVDGQMRPCAYVLNLTYGQNYNATYATTSPPPHINPNLDVPHASLPSSIFQSA